MRVGREEVVWELRGVEAQLKEWSAWAGKLRRGGLTAACSSPGFCGWRSVVFWGVELRSKRKEERNSFLGLLWCSCARQRGFWGSALG